MQIVASQGDTRFLVHLEDPNLARVLDLNQGRFFPPFNIRSILARGYWEEYTPKGPHELETLLAQIGEKLPAGNEFR
jgi:hypothetical protein